MLPAAVVLLACTVRTAPAAMTVLALVLTSAGEYSCRLAVADGYVSDFRHPRQHISYTFGYASYDAVGDGGMGGGDGGERCVPTQDSASNWERAGAKRAGRTAFVGALICMTALSMALPQPAAVGSPDYKADARVYGWTAIAAVALSFYSVLAVVPAFFNPICGALEGGQGCSLASMGRVALAGSACWLAAGLALGFQCKSMVAQMERHAERQRQNEAQDEHERLVVDGRVSAHAVATDTERGFVVPSSSSLLAGGAASMEEEEAQGGPDKVRRIEMVLKQ